MKLKLLLALLALSIISLTACTTTAPAFEDIEWVLESYGEKGNLKPVLKDTEVTAKFDSTEGKIGGTAGCNRYFGGYETNKTELTIIPPIGSTMMYCEGLMDQEQEFLKILEGTESYQVKDGKLQITSGNKLLIFKQK